MAIKRSAFGAKLLLSDGAATPVFTEVPGVGDFGAPFPQTENEDVTSHDSVGRWREFIQTVRDGGEISIPLQFDFAEPTHQDLIQASGEFGSKTFQVQAPTGETIAEFSAFVGVDGTSMFPVTGSQQVTVNLRSTGEVLLPFITP